jgi:predicted nucleotidyltransferase
MKSLDEIKEIIDIHKDELRKEYGLKEIGVFGSYVRGAQRADSDLDILIEFEKPVGFVKFLRLENRLSQGRDGNKESSKAFYWQAHPSRGHICLKTGCFRTILMT